MYMKDIVKDRGSTHLETCNWYFVYSFNCMPMLEKTSREKYDVGFMDKLASFEGNQRMDIKKKRKKKNNASRRNILGASSSQLDKAFFMEKMKNLMLECNRVFPRTPFFFGQGRISLHDLSINFKDRQLVHFSPKEEFHSLPQNPIMVPLVSHPSLDLIEKALNLHGLLLWNRRWLQKFGLLDLNIFTYSRTGNNSSIISTPIWS